MDEKPEDLWIIIVDTFGHQFFLPVIEKLYSHIFNADPKKLELELYKIIE
jgi:hypothetical protein